MTAPCLHATSGSGEALTGAVHAPPAAFSSSPWWLPVQARTPLVALLDVDLVVSQSLYGRMQRKEVVDTMVQQVRAAGVAPGLTGQR